MHEIIRGGKCGEHMHKLSLCRHRVKKKKEVDFLRMCRLHYVCFPAYKSDSFPIIPATLLRTSYFAPTHPNSYLSRLSQRNEMFQTYKKNKKIFQAQLSSTAKREYSPSKLCFCNGGSAEQSTHTGYVKLNSSLKTTPPKCTRCENARHTFSWHEASTPFNIREGCCSPYVM